MLNCWVTETKDTPGFEEFDDLGEIGKRPGQPVDLVDHDRVDASGTDIVQQGGEGRAVHRTTREPPSS